MLGTPPPLKLVSRYILKYDIPFIILGHAQLLKMNQAHLLDVHSVVLTHYLLYIYMTRLAVVIFLNSLIKGNILQSGKWGI